MTSRADEPRSIVWLASYPKSGNTWVRAQLTAVVRHGAIDLNRLIGAAVAQDRHAFEDSVALDASEMRPEQLAYYRSIFHQQLASHPRPFFVKVHDRFSGGEQGDGLFPTAASAGVIYIVRNPLDVAVSLAHHSGATIDSAINRMNDESATLNKMRGGWNSFLPVELGSWSTHVQSWLEQKALPLLLIHYEDMIADPACSLARIAEFSGLAVDTERVKDAVARSRFSLLKQTEIECGFAERPSTTSSFFREGRAGSWRTAMTSKQVERVLRDHSTTMSKLGMALEAR